MSNKKLTRRDFVKLGTSSLLLPLMPSLLPLTARAAGSAPLRLVVFVSYNGVESSSFWPSVVTNQVAANVKSKKLSEIAGNTSGVFNANFDSLKNKFSLIRGMSYPVSSTKAANGATYDQVLHWGAEVLTLNTPFSTANDNEEGPRFGSSLDAVVEHHSPYMGGKGAIRLDSRNWLPGGHEFFSAKQICYYRPNGQATSLQNKGMIEDRDPNAFFNRFLGNVSGNSQPVPVATNRNAAFDFALAQFSALSKSSSLSTFDKVRLQEHTDMLNDVKKRVVASQPTAVSGCQPNTIAPIVGSAVNKYRLDNCLNTIAASIGCDLTRLSVISMDAYDDTLIVGAGHDHENSHHFGDLLKAGGKSDNYTANCNQWKGWQATRIANFMKKLDSMIDVDGKTVLDNTIVLWTNQHGCGEHKMTGLPIMVGGGGGGLLRMGEYIDYRTTFGPGNDGFGRPVTNLFTSIFKTMNVPADIYAVKQGQDGAFGMVPPANDSYANAHNAAGNFWTIRREALPYFYKGS